MRKRAAGVCVFALCVLVGAGATGFSWGGASLPVPRGLWALRRAYPDVRFSAQYDFARLDWRIDVTVPGAAGKKAVKRATFYWADGSMLPAQELERREKYWTLLYHYAEELKDPATMSEEEVARMRSFGSTDNRRNGAGTPMFFFEFLYDADSRADLESHIVSVRFLGKPTKVHERILPALRRVEARVNALAQSDSDVRSFLENLSSTDAYYWRRIAGTQRLSFHSLGIAVDVLPKNRGGKEIFWSWTRDRVGADWILTPLSRRWMPPASVIAVFEGEGFIWGGKWGIFDNMHFEYHPELFQIRLLDAYAAARTR